MNTNPQWGLAMAATVILSGCAATGGYPENWSPMVPSDSAMACPNVTGTFSNVGTVASDDDALGSLAMVLAGNDVGANALTLSMIDDTLTISPVSMGQSPISRVIPRHRDTDFECREGKLWVTRDVGAVISGAPSGESRTFALSLTESGSVVAELDPEMPGLGSQLILPFPVRSDAADYMIWHRYGLRERPAQ